MKNVEAAYPLSPMQQGMLFHSLFAQTPGMYLEQIRATLEGELDLARLQAAWQRVVDRHTILRTAIVWEGIDDPLQIVRRHVQLPWSEHDLRNLDREQHQAGLSRVLQADRDLGFELTQAPLMRCTAVRRTDRVSDLIWTYHHMILDGWCSSIIVQEVFTIYHALGGSAEPVLDEPRPYREYITWLSKQDRGCAERFWRKVMGGVTSPTELRLERGHRNTLADYDSFGEYTEHVACIDSGLAAAVRSVARSHRVTLSTVVQGAWAILLSRYGGDDDVVFGATVSGRPPHLRGMETMLGLFVNTLPVRVQIDPGERLMPWLERLQREQLKREEYAFTSLVDIQSWVGLSPGTSLFETVVAFENYPVDRQTTEPVPGLRIVDSRVSMEETNYPLVLQVLPEPEFTLRVLFDASRYPHDAIVRLCRHLTTILEAVSSNPQQKLGQLSLLTQADLRQVHDEWASVVETPSERCLHELFEEVTARCPETVAVTTDSENLTYGALNGRANRLARHLRTLGVGPDILVGLCLDRSADLIVALLAILKAGGAYLPLDPKHPHKRLEFVLEDARAPVVVTTSALALELPGTRAAIVTLDQVRDGLADLSDGNLGVKVDSDHLAYVIYTSGSTGRPKGSLITHRNVTRLFSSTQSRFVFSESDVWTLFHTIAFDFSVWEIWGALLYGGRLVVVPHWICRSPEEFLDLLVSERVTVLNQTPSAFRQLMHSEGERNTPPRLALRLVIFGGERLDLASLRPWFDRHEDEHPCLVNMYGITETTVHVTWKFLNRSDLDAPGSLIGEAIPDLRVAILDRRQMPVPIGVAGELCIAGPGLSRGYLGWPELTAQKFIESPFPIPADERLYRSGDLVRRLSDGVIEYLGRIDQQVKIRGFRIELGEIEGVLTEHPEVRECVVIERSELAPDSDHEVTLAAYVVPANDSEEAAAESVYGSQSQVEVVSQWERVFEEQYRGGKPDRDLAFDITGWNSSYSGEPLRDDEMREWVERTAERIRMLAPRHVLEIGCGTGLLVGRIAPHCRTYIASDFSHEALDVVERLIATTPELAHVRLRRQAADAFEELGRERFDTIVLNSVAQYFPSVDYFVNVMHGALDHLEPGGVLFVGDVRSRALLPAYHASVEFDRARTSATLSQLRQRILQCTAEEEELVLDPELFVAIGDRLGDVSEVAVQLKRGRFHNEMTRFRYDVCLRKSSDASLDYGPEISWHSWREGSSSITQLRAELETGRPACVGWRGVPNARLRVEIELLNRLEMPQFAGATVGSLRSALAEVNRDTVDPEDLWALGDELSYHVELAISTRQIGCFDVVLTDGDQAGTGTRNRFFSVNEDSHDDRSWRTWANDPMRRLRSRRLGDGLREHLKEQLPDYMVPANVVVLEALPLTVNGKIDLKALPVPELKRQAGDCDLRPRNACEEILIGIWEDVLGVGSIGREDNFFDLGGHSLMATQVISRVRSAFAIEVPMRELFALPTVAEFAAEIEARRLTGVGSAGPALVACQSDGRPPLSFSQQRLWFLDQLEGPAATYNVPLALEIRGPLDVAVLTRSLEHVVARHATLRTVFAVEDGVPYQKVSPPGPVAVPVVDLRDAAVASRAAEARRQAHAAATRPFDLARGPMLRASVYRIADEEHLLLLCMHHICTDGWSTGVLLRELGHLYGSLARDNEPEPMTDLPIQYVDYALWQRQWLTGETLERQLEYWRSRLNRSHQCLMLPTDRPRPPVLTFHGRSESFFLNQELTDRLRHLGRKCGATLYMTLLAGFGALLHRYTGADRVVIGTPVANRRRSETESLIGFFVNTLAVDIDCSGGPSFRAFLERVRHVTLAAYDHQDLPFEALVEALHPRRDLSHTPIFQTMFVLQNTPIDTPRLAGLSTSTVALDLGISKFELTLSLEEGHDGLIGELQYNTELFDIATINRVISHYRNLLAGAVDSPGSPLWQLPLLDDRERAQLTVVWNDTKSAGSDRDRIPFHVAFARRVFEDPERPAVVTRNETLTYAELDSRAEDFAQVLQEAGVGSETLVPVCIERGLWWVVAVLAVAKAGGAFVVLDPAYPDERLAFTVVDTGASVVVTQEEHRRRFDGLAAQLLMVGSAATPSIPSGGTEVTDTELTHPAYAVYTSGTTGRPKGVVVTHDSLSNLIHAQVERFDIGPGNRILQFVAPTFDVAVADIGMALTTGAALCVAPTEDLLPGPGLIELMRELRVTHIASPPAPLAATNPEDLPDLRVVIVGGEPCPTEVVERWAPGRRFFNCYGPTEATICATMSEYAHDGRALSIGRPLDNVSVHILDRHGQTVPIGVAGELYIGGRGVARGYLGLPDLTTERFVSDPFDTTSSARLYRTGDLARHLLDGNIEFMGRADRQIKIRGYRVEPEEIEAVLREHSAVTQAVVLVLDSPSGDRQLAACVEADPGTIDMEELRAHMRRRLPHYMLPSRLVPMLSLPLTGTGKIDSETLRCILATIEESPPTLSREKTTDEARMAEIWQEVLERRHLDLEESFFECGGHSLAAMRVIARVHEVFAVEVPVRELFEAPTLAAFTQVVVDRGQTGDDTPPLRRMPRRTIPRPASARKGSR